MYIDRSSITELASTITSEDCLQYLRDNGDIHIYMMHRNARLDPQWFYNALSEDKRNLLGGTLYDPFYKRSEPHNAIATAVAYLTYLEVS